MPNNNTPERPLVTERLAALDSNGNDCKLARYVLYLEGEVRRLLEMRYRLNRLDRWEMYDDVFDNCEMKSCINGEYYRVKDVQDAIDKENLE